MPTSDGQREQNHRRLQGVVSKLAYFGGTLAMSYMIPFIIYMGLRKFGGFRPFLDWNRIYHVTKPQLEIVGALWQPNLLWIAVPSFVLAHLVGIGLSLPILFVVEKFKKPSDSTISLVRFSGVLAFFYALSAVIIWAHTDYTWGRSFTLPIIVAALGLMFLSGGAKSSPRKSDNN